MSEAAKKEKEKNPLVWVKDNAGNLYICPLNDLRDPNVVSEDEKSRCINDAKGYWQAGSI